jgi:hypothetical protein
MVAKAEVGTKGRDLLAGYLEWIGHDQRRSRR